MKERPYSLNATCRAIVLRAIIDVSEDEPRYETAHRLMKERPYSLNATCRAIVLRAIIDVCKYR